MVIKYGRLFLDESIMSIESEEKHPNLRMYFDRVFNIYGNGICTVQILPVTSQWLGN